MAKVVNLATGEEREYSLDAAQAVVAAREQEKGNWNTWTYKDSKEPIIDGKRSVACGSWAALK